MRHFPQFARFVAIALCSLRALSAQDLRPRAYVITPIHSNAVILGYALTPAVFSLELFYPSPTPRDNTACQISPTITR